MYKQEIWVITKRKKAEAAKGKKDAKKDSIILNRTGGESSKNVPKISVFLPKRNWKLEKSKPIYDLRDLKI